MEPVTARPTGEHNDGFPAMSESYIVGEINSASGDTAQDGVVKSPLPETMSPASFMSAPESPGQPTPISITVELAGQLRVPTDMSREGSRNPRLDMQSRPQSSSSSRFESEYDIELETFSVLPVTGTTSTEHLVPLPRCDSPSKYRKTKPSGLGNKIKSARPVTPKGQSRPSHKPFPLQWPFLAFLFAFMAGIFAFLEYQVHDLPPLHYSVIKVGSGEMAADPGMLPKQAVARPPDPAYPTPAHLVHTYCGWYPPQWNFSSSVADCDESWLSSCEEYPYLCSGNQFNPDTRCFSVWLQEVIVTFTTNDTSWCPCQLDSVYFGSTEYWSQDGVLFSHRVWETDDQGCKSAMVAIESFNWYKQGATPFSSLGIGIGESTLPFSSVYQTPPPLPEKPSWAYPTTNMNGKIMMPLVIRTAGLEQMDVFGNSLKPSDVAQFADIFHSKRPPEGWVYNCFFDGEGPPGFRWGRECTETATTLSTVWWALPLSGPKSTLPSTTDMTTTTSTISSTSLPQRSTLVPQGKPSFDLQPVCTSCNADPQASDKATTSSVGKLSVPPPGTDSTVPPSKSQERSITSPPGPPWIQDAPAPPSTLNNSGWSPDQQRPHGPVPPQAHSAFYNLRSEAAYLMVSVIPVLLATVLSIPIQVFASSLSSMLPFRALGFPGGATATDSLCLSRNPSLLSSQVVSFRFVKQFRDPLPLLSTILGTLSLILVPISSEVLLLEFTSDCGGGGTSFLRVCAYGLRKSGGLIRVAEGLLVAMALLVIAIAFLLVRWRSSVTTDPWSIASMASLLTVDSEVCRMLRSIPAPTQDNVREHSDVEMRKVLEGVRFRLGSLTTPASDTLPTLGIEVVPISKQDKQPIRLTSRDPPRRQAKPIKERRSIFKVSPRIKQDCIRFLVLLFTLGLLILILVYENTIAPDTPFEAFMNSQSFGVRILFAIFGVIISTFWNYYFLHTSEFQIHQRLATSPTPLPAELSMLLSPPSNVFIGLYRSMVNIKDFQAFNIALATLFAKFTPILLSNIPFYNTVTFKIHEACTWMAVVFLSHMVLVLATSILVPILPAILKKAGRNSGTNRKHSGANFPVKVDTIAGCMYYICDSKMLEDFEGLSAADIGPKKRDRLVCEMGKEYTFGEMVGVSGTRRAGVDYIDDERR